MAVDGYAKFEGDDNTPLRPDSPALAGQYVPLDGDVGFYGTAPIAQQTGVAVSAAGIHAALVALGLITA